MNIFSVLMFAFLMAVSGCTTSGKTTGDVIDDTTISTAVKTRMLRENFGDGLDVNVEIYKGIVQLGGFIDSGRDAVRMADIAAAVDGVVEVDNQLYERQSERSAGQAVDDGITTSRVKAQITGADLGDGFVINVDTYDGTVLLTGFVVRDEQKDRAGSIAEKDNNTRKVINGLYVIGR